MTANRIRYVQAGRPDPGPHPHYWLIATPAGPESEGICQVCGEHRMFKNGEQDPGDLLRVHHLSGTRWGKQHWPKYRVHKKGPPLSGFHIEEEDST